MVLQVNANGRQANWGLSSCSRNVPESSFGTVYAGGPITCKVVQVDYERVLIDSDVPEDPEIAAMVETHTRELSKQLDAPAGPVAVPLEGRFVVVRTRECNLGNLVADIALAALNVNPQQPVDCVIVNSGTLRSDTVHAAGMLLKKVSFLESSAATAMSYVLCLVAVKVLICHSHAHRGS